jgi:hypothetical protein
MDNSVQGIFNTAMQSKSASKDICKAIFECIDVGVPASSSHSPSSWPSRDRSQSSFHLHEKKRFYNDFRKISIA